MSKLYFRNGEFVQPVVTHDEIKYEIHKDYILRTQNGITTEITLDAMSYEMCSNDGLTDEEIKKET